MSDFILTNMSRLNRANSFHNFNSELGTIKGRYTNEAPVKFLLNTVHQSHTEGECCIIAVTTPESQEAFKALQKTIRRYCRKNHYAKVSIEKIDFNRNFSAVISQIVKRVHQGDRIYIDTTGGFRDSAYLIMAIVRIFEYSEIHLEKAVYAFYDKDCPKNNRIEDITGIYRMFNLINATNSFTSFGNADELAEVFAECNNTDIKKAIDVMHRFSDEVALCRTSKLNSLMDELNEILLKLQNSDTDVENEILFKSLAGVIREKFGSRDSKTIDYIDVIEWCLDNKMIQQAVTIYVEKMPEYLFRNGFLSCDLSSVKVSSFPKTFDLYYNLLYNDFLKLTTEITMSPYPLGNLLFRLKEKRKNIYKELCEIDNINNFSIRNSLSPEERQGVLNLIRVKNAVFAEPSKKRTAEDIESRKQNTKLKCFADSGIFESLATTTESFVNELLKRKEYIRLLQGEYTPYSPRVWNATDLNVLEHLERVLSENKKKYTAKSKMAVDDLRSILENLIYVKRYIRNALNHASEEGRISDEYDEYFSEHGYNVSNELSINEIETTIRKAIFLVNKQTL